MQPCIKLSPRLGASDGENLPRVVFAQAKRLNHSNAVSSHEESTREPMMLM